MTVELPSSDKAFDKLVGDMVKSVSWEVYHAKRQGVKGFKPNQLSMEILEIVLLRMRKRNEFLRPDTISKFRHNYLILWDAWINDTAWDSDHWVTWLKARHIIVSSNTRGGRV